MRNALAFFATGLILTLSLLLVSSALASDPTISITPDTTVFINSGDPVRIWIYASDPDPLDSITVEKTYGTGTYDPRTELAPISDEFFFTPDTAGLYTFIFPVTDEGGATGADTTTVLAKKVDFRQSANDDSPYPPGDVHWIGSILQQSNSKYYEGMSTLQRIVFINIPKTADSVHTLNFSHQANKSANIHAYDFLTSWPQGVQAGTEIGGSTMFVSVNECGPEIGPPADLGAICTYLHTSGDSAIADAPDSMGTLLGDDVDSAAAAYEAQLGNRTVKIYGNTAIDSASITFNGYTGSTDKYADYTLTWTSSSDSIVIEMAGHLAASTDPVGQPGVGYGPGRGSASISGGPYHFKLATLDGASLGSQDNQIKGADIILPPPVCDVTPDADAVCTGGSATFTDSPTGGTSPYTWAWTGPNGFTATTQSITINNAQLVNAGTYQVIVTDANDLKDTCYAVLVVHPNPSCSVNPPSAAICEGDCQQICVVPSGGTPPHTYLWSTGGTTACIQVCPPVGSYTYWVEVTDANGCVDTCQATLTVNPGPSCSVNPPSAAICQSDSQQFCVVPSGGTPPYLYLWNTGATTQCIYAKVAGTYSVTVTDANNCATSCQATLTVYPNPTCTVNPPSAAICQSDSQQFCVVPSGGTPPYIYLWSNGATTQCIYAKVAGTYPVTITDANNCTTSCQATLTVYPNPTCTVNPPSAAICQSDSQQFCVVPSGGTPPYLYLWNTGATTQCIYAKVAGTYSVTVTDANGCATSCQATLTVYPNPTCTVNPPSAAICEGDSQQFCVVPSGGTPPYTYLWSPGGETTQCITKSAAGTYPVTVTDANNCTTSCQATLTVNPNPTCSVDPPSAQICEGGSQQFCVVPSGGTPPYIYLWDNGATTQCITVSAAGTYCVTVTDANNCTTSCQATLTVYPNPTCTVNPPSAAICEGDSQQFCVVPSGGTPPYLYLWNTGATTQCIYAKVAGTYPVTVTDANNCTTSCQATLTVYPNPTCTVDPPSAQICEGGSQQFCVQPTGGTPPYTYLWSPGGETTQCITVSPPAGSYTYWLMVTDANGCTTSCAASLDVVENPTCTVDPPSAVICEGGSQQFCAVPSGTPPFTYLWSPGGETTQCITASAAGTYSVTVTDAQDCTSSCEASLMVVENPTCGINPPSASICEGDSQQFCAVPSGGTPPYTYVWTPGGETTRCITASAAGTYSVTVTDANDCTTSCQATLTVNPNPSCTVDPPSATICEGDDQEFCAVPSGGTPPYTYLWSPGGETTQCITASAAGTYSVTVTDANGCATNCQATLTVNPNPTCTVNPPSAAICEGCSQEFCVVPSGGTPPYAYLWSPGGETTQCITASAAGTYSVAVTDANDCTTSCQATLTVYPSPTCSVAPPSATINVGDNQQFCVVPSSGTPPYTYLWNTGEVTQCITVSPPEGSYTYWVKVTDAGANACTSSCETRLAVVDTCCPSVWIDTIDCVNPGDYVEVPIYLECTPAFCGFELEVEFDYTSMTFVGAQRGRLIPEGDFEYFTYRVLPCPACGCCKYKILLFGMCDLPDDHVGVPIPELTGADTLVILSFVVNSDENLRGLMIPICWEWEGTIDPETGCLTEDWNCEENTFSSVTGDTLYTSMLCCQFVDSLCDDPTERIASIMSFQPDTNCVPDCFRICGGILICPAGPGECKRGDINYNTLTYEVADAVLFASYFVEGTVVFRYDEPYQICATDVNADGRTLTLSDLVYMIRIILHDAVELPKLTPSSEIANVIVSGGTISTECAAPIGAILFEFDAAVNPTLLADMEMVHNGNKVLVWSSTGKSFNTAQVVSYTGDAKLVSVSAVDRDTRELNTTITARVAPTAFALNRAYPNPFNPFVNLSFNLPEAASYSLKIYNVAGQLVRRFEGVGSQNLNVVTWDGRDNRGDEVSSGVYFYRLTAAGFSATQKMVMMK